MACHAVADSLAEAIVARYPCVPKEEVADALFLTVVQEAFAAATYLYQ